MDRKTGVVVPLAALWTKECPAVGEFTALKKFADFCKKAGFGVIQLLPVNDTGTQSSPYSGLSAYALHPMYISIKALPEFEDAFANDKAFAAAYKKFEKNFKYAPRYNYNDVTNEKISLLHLLWNYLNKKMNPKKKDSETDKFAIAMNKEIDDFVKANRWVIPYAVYKNLKDAAMQASWKEWDPNLQHLDEKQIKLRWDNKALKASHNFFVWCQIRGGQQFKEAADYVKKQGIVLKGDIPILMNDDSCDAWAYPQFFNQELRAGSPPDGENPVGQNWGFPTYNWKNLAADNYSWWKERIKCAAQYYSAFRIDHVLGFFRIWSINDGDSTAYLGHSEPCRKISRDELHGLGFDDGKINWLAEPHISTGEIENITWNHDEAVAVLSKVCNRIGDQELWNFKPEIKTDKQIYTQCFFAENGDKDGAIKHKLSEKWRDRALIKMGDNEFVRVWRCENSTAWNSLRDDEKWRLKDLFNRTEAEEEQLWKQQAYETLSMITKTADMTACAEDLGVNLKVMPEVLQSLNIMSLRVVRWSRNWREGGSPYYVLQDFPHLSVTTTSVHDSSTLRQWWCQEKDSVQAYLNMWQWADKHRLQEEVSWGDANAPFTPDTANFMLKSSACTGSAWFVNPLQDYLYLDGNYYLEDMDAERINVPGSVNEFNWTYRLPVSVEDLLKNKEIINKINTIAQIHDRA